MSLKERVLSILEHSQKVQQAFVTDLSDEQRSEVGTYEKWSAKDELAHIAYWQEQRAIRVAAEARGEEVPPAPAHYEQANAECFERFCSSKEICYINYYDKETRKFCCRKYRQPGGSFEEKNPA